MQQSGVGGGVGAECWRVKGSEHIMHDAAQEAGWCVGLVVARAARRAVLEGCENAVAFGRVTDRGALLRMQKRCCERAVEFGCPGG